MIDITRLYSGDILVLKGEDEKYLSVFISEIEEPGASNQIAYKTEYFLCDKRGGPIGEKGHTTVYQGGVGVTWLEAMHTAFPGFADLHNLIPGWQRQMKRASKSMAEVRILTSDSGIFSQPQPQDQSK